MSLSPSTPRPGVVLATRIALALVAVALVIGEVAVVTSIAPQLAAEFPEFAHLQPPLVAAFVAFGVCLAVILAATGILVGYARDGRLPFRRAITLVGVMIGASAGATVSVVVALVLSPGPPPLGLLLLGATLTGIAVTLVLVVLRSRLARAAMASNVATVEVTSPRNPRERAYPHA